MEDKTLNPKTCVITHGEIKTVELEENITHYSTRIQIQRKDFTSVWGEVHGEDRMELESFANHVDAIPELVSAVENYICLKAAKNLSKERMEEAEDEAYKSLQAAFRKARKMVRDPNEPSSSNDILKGLFNSFKPDANE